MQRLALDGRVALVTGAAHGIGRATARLLHARGASVALVDLDGGGAAAAAEELGERALAAAADVADADAVAAAVELAVERFGGLDVCVANAGVAPAAATVRAMEDGVFERVVEVNLLGSFRTVRAALPQIAARGGHVALVASIYAFFNGLLLSPYAASKAAVEQLGRALRAELAPHGASAGVAYYGFVDTAMVAKSLEDPLAARFEAERIPRFVRRRLTPDQAARALVDGIERRAPRTFAPGWLRPYSALRGVVNPLLDRRFERDPAVLAFVREGDVEGRARTPVQRPPAG